jgi:NADH-quinone oxidoreductase subunit D
VAAENPRGELGFYVVSDGGTKPVRLRIRTGSFSSLAVMPEICRGAMVADVVAILGSIDFVLPEVDR